MSDPIFPPQNEEIAVHRFLDALDGEAEAARREISRDWDENLRQVRGEQWRIRRPPYFLANIIKNQVRRKVGALTEVRSQFQVQSIRSDLDQASNVLYNACRSILDQNHTQDAWHRCAFFAMPLGCGFIQLPYDPMLNDVQVSFVDPRRVWIDPAVTSAPDLERVGQYVRIDTVLPLTDIRRRFPGRGQLVKPDNQYSLYTDPGARSKLSVIASVLQAMPRVYKPGQSTKAGPIPRAILREYWIRDPQNDAVGNPLFPGGRHVIRAGNVLLLDEANPYWDGGWPIEMFEWDIDFDTPWGLGEVMDLRRIQESINRSGDAWIRNLLLGSNFRVIADLDALDPDQWDKLDNEAGLIIRKKPQRQLEYVPPVEDRGTMPQAIQALIALCDLLTGNGDNSKSPAQGAAALEGLQTAKQLLVRSIARRMESLMERVGQKLISRIFQFYTADRILMQQGPNRDWMAYTFKRQQLLMDDSGKMRSAEERTQMWRDFKFLVTPGSSLASSRIQRVMALLQLRSATGVAPSIRRILQEADIGDPDSLIKEGLQELQALPVQAPVPKGKGGRQ